MEIISSKDWGMIIKVPLVPLELSLVDAIGLHHMAHPTAGIKEVEQWHLNLGWRAFGYNYWIGFDGQVYEGRGLFMGAGVENQNDHIISVGFQGDYHSNPVTMSKAQFNAGIDMILWLRQRVPTIKTIDGHKHFMATACPGQYFPLAEMQTLKKRDTLISYADSISFWQKRGVIGDAEIWYGGTQDAVDCEWLCKKTATYSKTGKLDKMLSFAEAIYFWETEGVISSPAIWYEGRQDSLDGEWLCRKTAQFELDK